MSEHRGIVGATRGRTTDNRHVHKVIVRVAVVGMRTMSVLGGRRIQWPNLDFRAFEFGGHFDHQRADVTTDVKQHWSLPGTAVVLGMHHGCLSQNGCPGTLAFTRKWAVTGRVGRT
jgi:hypothetical protein